jgi:2,3-bisphosphoglycerate-independent phosphoglycerate mutase
MVILDGLGDDTIKELYNKTPFEYAETPNMDKLAFCGRAGNFNVCPQGCNPESMVCILNLFQIDKKFFGSGRAYFELISHGYEINDNQVVLRCNLAVADNDNKLVSFNGGSLSGDKMEQILKQIKSKSSARFIHLSGYRNLIVMNKADFKNLECRTFPPHEHIGDNITFLLSEICLSSDELRNFLQDSNEVLNKYSDQEYRYYLHPWGLSQKTQLPSFEQLHHKKAAAVCAAEIAKGIALALDMYVPKLHSATADTDTNLLEKAQVTCEMLNNHDFVFVHINGTDEAAHRRDYLQKTRFIEDIDKIFFAYLFEYLDCETKIMICGDHSTSSITGKHSKNPVPFILSEINGKKSSNIFDNDITVKDAFNYLISE